MSRLLLTGLLIVVFGVALGFALTAALRPRAGSDDVITGGPGPGAAAPARPAPPTPDPSVEAAREAEIERLRAQAEAAPADVDAQLALVRAALDAGRGDLAMPALGRVLDRHPKHPGALTYLGLISAAQGQVDHGLELVDQALAAAPDDTFALWARGGLLFQHRQDYAGAAAAWERMLRSPKVDDATRETVREWIAEARWRAEHGGEPRGDGGAAGRPPAVASGRPLVTGTVSLGPGVEGGSSSGVLYVIARRGAGPPLAVKRIESPRFPVAYTLGPEDAMVPGRPVEGSLEIVARLSRGGAAGPAKPGDLEGRAARNPVTPGAAGVDIVLTPVAGPDASPGGSSR
jgi:cytochrome c-type biogenesis protein CcmH